MFSGGLARSRRRGFARRLVATLTCGILLALGSSGALAQEIVRVGSTLDLVPFTFVDTDGRPTGFELDLLALIGERLGLRFEYVKTPVTQAFTGLAADKYRLSASAIAIRCERIVGAGKVGRFTVPTFSQGYVISAAVGHRDRTTSFDALRGLRVGVEARGSTGDTLTEAQRARVGFTKIVFDNATSQFLALQQGRIDAAIQGELVSRHVARSRPDIMAGEPLPGTTIPVGFVFRDGDELRLRFNEAIDALKRAGAVARLYEQWFGAAPRPGNTALEVVPEVTMESCRSAS
jgi:ABC-type amino acid transport substrate-binding protein